MSKQIPVGLEHFAIVDDTDYEELNKFVWSLRTSSSRAIYAIAKYFVNGSAVEIYMHKMLTGYQMTDHINGNGLDNRRENLRPSSMSQNKANQPKVRGNYYSEYKGVTWSKKNSKWLARIRVNYKTHNLGSFSNEIEAAKAYDSAAEKYFGAFAYKNFGMQR